MSARRTSARIACALIAAGSIALAQAQERINVEDLRVRAESGERGATRELAEAYYLGRGGVPQDFKEAFRWYLRLARQGDARAQTSVGLMYARGYGVEKSVASAQKWWSYAAAQNEAGAQFNLGMMYSGVEGVAPDYPQAVHWYTQAANRGHVQAQHNLGMLYHEGKGVARDPVRAYFWVGVAALQGDDVARGMLEALRSGMSMEQIRAAERQSAEWAKKPGKPPR